MTETPKPSRDISDLIAVMAALRTPVTGCPWDLEQTFATIAPYTIEEAYEVADAIARGDRADLKDELGDLLLQAVYHARLAEEEKSFDFGDVVYAVTQKMIRRHPHVFGDQAARTAGAAKGFWEAIKATERAEKAKERAAVALRGDDTQRGARDRADPKPPSLLADVPVGLPALTRAIKLQDKAARVGFDWPSLAPVFEKMREELGELEAVCLATLKTPLIAPSDSPAGSRPEGARDRAGAIQEEFGDLLFVMANVARHLQLDPEAALRAANQKFTRRFAHIEQRLAAQGRSPPQSNLAEMDALWDEAKAREKG